MTLQDYALKSEEIAKREFMSNADMLREMNITFNTWSRFKKSPGSCSVMTIRKIKRFIDKWSK